VNCKIPLNQFPSIPFGFCNARSIIRIIFLTLLQLDQELDVTAFYDNIIFPAALHAMPDQAITWGFTYEHFQKQYKNKNGATSSHSEEIPGSVLKTLVQVMCIFTQRL
jgi:hypothetical protein